MTDNQKAIINSDRSVKYVRLEFPGHEIENIEAGQIYLESLNLEESIFEGDNLTFGKCNGSIFKIRVADFTENIENARMNVYVKFTHPDLGEVDIPFGKYIISQPPERTSDRRWRDITATDYMTLFDVDIADWYINTLFIDVEKKYTLKKLRELLCDYIGVEYEKVTLPNDNLSIGKTMNPQTLTGRDFLEMLLQPNASFGHFDWNGTLNFITLSKDDEKEVISDYKQGGCQYEDYDIANFNTVVIQDEEGNTAVTYQPQSVIRENRYVIANNPLLFDLNAEQLTEVATNFFNAIYDITYRTNTTQVFSKIYMQLGQSYEVNSKTYIGSEVIDTTFQSFVLKRTITGIQNISSTLEAMGQRYSSDTRDIASEISSLRNKSNVLSRELEAMQNKILIYLLYDNDSPYDIKSSDEKETEIISIDFKTNKKCYVVFHASVIFNLVTDSSEVTILEEDYMSFNDGDVQFQFIVNNLPIPDYTPKVTYQDGTYTIHLEYAWYDENVDESLEQRFSVVCTVKDCEITIPTYRIHGYLTSDGLVIDSEWDGKIFADETFNTLSFNSLVHDFSDNANLITMIPQTTNINESFGRITFNSLVDSFTDSLSMFRGMYFSTVVNLTLLNYTATISNNTFINGEVITPNIYDISNVSVKSTNTSYQASFDDGETWVGYNDNVWTENFYMSSETIENIPQSAWNSPAMIKAIISESGTLTDIKMTGGHLQ